MDHVFERLEALGAARVLVVSEPALGLRALLVLDDTTLGPGVGGVRTWAYGSANEALADACGLARAMTVKCALAGLPAGGAKMVVLAQAGLQRAAAFARLGAFVEELGGLFRTAGDLGTTADDLRAMATTTRFVHTNERELAASVGRGLLRCVEACREQHDGRSDVTGLRVLVQGAGAIGAAVTRALADAGAELLVADVDAARAHAVADQTGARVVPAADALLADVDVIAPCAVGGVIDRNVASSLRAWAVCGAANNVLADRDAALGLAERGILFVPDVLASAGAVVDGIGESLLGLADRSALVDGLGASAREVLREARATGALPSDVALSRARARIEAARAARYARG